MLIPNAASSWALVQLPAIGAAGAASHHVGTVNTEIFVETPS